MQKSKINPPAGGQKYILNIKNFCFLLCIFAICYLMFAIPSWAQGVEIGEWFKFRKECKSEAFVHETGKYECIKWEETSIKDFFPDFSSFGGFISSVLPNIYVIAGIILLFLLIFGGFTYIVNAGKQDTEGIKKGKQAITAALVGFALIFGSWWIIQIVEVVTGIDILK